MLDTCCPQQDRGPLAKKHWGCLWRHRLGGVGEQARPSRCLENGWKLQVKLRLVPPSPGGAGALPLELLLAVLWLQRVLSCAQGPGKPQCSWAAGTRFCTLRMETGQNHQ